MSVVDRLARALEHRLDRRGFLARTAMGGTALAVAPVDFALRPGDAYAQVCRCGSSGCACGTACCDGYTEFCCTLYGTNRCPPGALIGGWWRVDGSSFCGGAARYYMDCHATCGGCGCNAGGVCGHACAGVTCGCAFGDCNRRRAACVLFRYGQCNQQVPCVGPIICRLVSCVPPWQIDSSCTTSVAFDEATRFHDAPCLRAGRGSIDVVALQGRSLRVAGWALDPNAGAPLLIRVFLNGQLAFSGNADRPRPDLEPFFPGIGPNHGYDVTFAIAPGQYSIEVFGYQVDGAADVVRLNGGTVSVGVPFGGIDVVSRVPGGIRVAGWVIDPDDAAQAHIYIDGRFVRAVSPTVSRPDVAAAYPGFAAPQGFDVVVPAEGGTDQVCVYAFNPGQPTLNPLLGCRTVTTVVDPIGAVDVITPVVGGIRVAGWTIDPDTVDPIDVHVYVDGALAKVVAANTVRTDVGAFFRGYGDRHGFDTVVAVAPGRHDVCVYAINSGPGRNGLIGCGSVTMSSIPFGSLDVVARQGDRVRVAGWAIDPDTVGAIDVHVYVDGQPVATAAASRRRTDIGAVYPAWGADHGFDVTVDAPGARSVCVYAINQGPGDNVLLACRAVS